MGVSKPSFCVLSLQHCFCFHFCSIAVVTVSGNVRSLSKTFSSIIWEVNRIDNEIKKWINLLPFDLETPQLTDPVKELE
jgi:hypothetical protein